MVRPVSIEENKARYEAALHAVMTGVGYTIPKNPKEVDPKHMRTGINNALLSLGALTQLLIDKGVITSEDYWKYLADYAEGEKKIYETELSNLYGAEINLI